MKIFLFDKNFSWYLSYTLDFLKTNVNKQWHNMYIKIINENISFKLLMVLVLHFLFSENEMLLFISCEIYLRSLLFFT